MKKASHKVPNGKKIDLKLEFRDEEVVDVEIRGDFFLEPAEKLTELENKIEGLSRDSSSDEIVDRLEEVEAKLIGFSEDDIGKAFEKAVGDSDE